jgi:ABC-type dipeptide/oligopeptide/nickel transport system permease subunit
MTRCQLSYVRVEKHIHNEVFFSACSISLLVGFFVTLSRISIDSAYRMIPGYCGEQIDLMLMRVTDALDPISLTLIVILFMLGFGKHVCIVLFAISIAE